MRNIFIGLISAFDNTRALEINKTNKNKDFLQETKYIISADANEYNKNSDAIYVDLSNLNLEG